MGVGGAPKVYTAKTLEKAVKKYFRHITRKRVLTEPVPTGELDKYGHPIYRQEPVVNDLGKKVEITEYLCKPTKSALALFLGIHRSTWDNYHDAERYPEFKDIVEWADDLIFAWTHTELLSRSGKDVRGIVCEMENAYGYRGRTEVEVNGMEDYLRRMDEMGEEGSF